MKAKPLVIPYKTGATPLNKEQADALFTQDQQATCSDIRGKLKHRGPWQIPISFKALCVAQSFNREVFPVEHGPLHIFGKRTLQKVKHSGYELEGKVKINGKYVRGFTSSQLFELPNKRLINVAIIHACNMVD